MGLIIAMAGKGGTGKSTIAAALVNILKTRKKFSILAIDADPNSNLGEILGIHSDESIGKTLDEVSLNPDSVPSGMTKERFLEYRLQFLIQEAEGFDLLTMGKPEGPGCYCYVNNILRGIMDKLIKDYDYVIIDNEAGLEHLSRRTTANADTLLVVSDASSVGLRSAQRIVKLAGDLKIRVKKTYLLINRFGGDINENEISKLGMDLLACLPFDKEVERVSISGESIESIRDKSLLYNSLKEIGEKIWQSN